MKQADGTLSMLVQLDQTRHFIFKGWRTYTAALEHAARLCADPDGDHSQETIDRTGG